MAWIIGIPFSKLIARWLEKLNPFSIGTTSTQSRSIFQAASFLAKKECEKIRGDSQKKWFSSKDLQMKVKIEIPNGKMGLTVFTLCCCFIYISSHKRTTQNDPNESLKKHPNMLKNKTGKKNSHNLFLVGSFNQFERYARQIGSFP